MKLDLGDLAVGVTVLLAAVLAIGAIVWLSPAAEQGQYVLFTEFDDVTGLDNQAPVYLRGYTIGRVTQIRPRLENGKPVFRVKMTLEPELRGGERLHLPEGTVARMTFPPFLGSGFILLELPDSGTGGKPLASGAGLPATRDELMSENLQKLSGMMGFALQDALTRTNVLLDTLTRTAAQANHLIATSDSVMPALTLQVGSALANVDTVTRMLKGTNDKLVPSVAATMDSAQRLLGRSTALLANVNQSLETMQPHVVNILANLDSTSFMAKDFIAQVSAKPLRVLTGVKLSIRDTAAARARKAAPTP